MRNESGVFDPEQLRTLQSIFDTAWVQATGSSKLAAIADWGALRDTLACRVMELAQTNLTDDEIIRAVLSSLGIL
jgi:hypothetical protein